MKPDLPADSPAERSLVALCTLGYEKRSLSEFIELLKDARNEVLVDVRETAWSHKPGFSKRPLQEALARAGIAYVHAAFAGNPKRLRDEARDHRDCLRRYQRHLEQNPRIVSELDSLLLGFERQGLRACLTCVERHPGDCHRGILSDAWSALHRGTVVHLAADGCPRLAEA